MKRQEFEVTELSGEKVKLVVIHPSQDDISDSETIYAAKVSQLIRESSPKKKLLLRNEVEKFLKDSGVWSDQDEELVKKYNEEIDGFLGKVRKGGIKLSEIRELCVQVMDRRRLIATVMRKRQLFDDITLESQSEEKRNSYLVWASTVYADDGRHYWLSVEDMEGDRSSEAYQKASVLAMQMIYGVDTRWEHGLPENRILIKYGFVDKEDLTYRDRKTGEKVDRNGVPVKKIEEENQKQFDNLQGEINPEKPFIDDETGKPVVFEEDHKEEIKEEKFEDSKEPVLAATS